MSLIYRLRRELSKGLSRSCQKTTNIRKNGVRIKVPLIHGVGASNHMILDERMSSFAGACAKSKSGLSLDVGANVGAFFIQLQSFGWFEGGGEYLGVEPNPLCAHYVNELTRLNGIPMADCLSVALAAEPSLPVLYGHKPADKMASLTAGYAYRAHRKQDFSHRIIAEKGDELLFRMGSPDVAVLKIDVEGHEGDVLAGLTHTLKTSKPWIFCEMWDLNDRAGETTKEDISRRYNAFSALKATGYVAYDANMDRRDLASLTSERFNSLGGTDVIFIPTAEVDTFESAWRHVRN